MKEKIRQKEIDKIFLNMAMYYGHELVPDVINIYHELLAEHSYQDINAACGIWMKKNQWFPKANEIIGIIEKNKGPQISLEARAHRQWRIVLAAVVTQGRANPPTFTDPITANLVKTQFRWPYLCDMRQENENWEQKRWCEAFKLAEEVHPDMKQIEVSPQVGKLADNVAKSVTEASPHGDGVSVEVIRKYHQKLRGQSSKPQENRETRVALLKKQAQQIRKEEIDKNERKGIE